ncbi:helix-turn-helix transcriptional regulator [Aquibacillus rhizosphaerae]|uniref:AraC family transcriptional regulator n=1 Tax=Aquibacillus rhizosphaerae TaxID=3051431 RepID=A0ABT7LA47_9BACI|nr:helix-turn-helix domain-containing protein [Aquibacillus sp. LR5S19]MDL4842060.1 AraC family transcriptional regulator [Aquibacillus sp. LR5S19]
MDDFLANYELKGRNVDIPLHSHQEYEIFLFHKGTCRYLIHNQIYDLIPGDILLMDGLALHKPNLPAHSDYVRSHIHFNPQTIMPLLEALNASHLLEAFERLHHCLIRPTDSIISNQIASVIKCMQEISKDENRTDAEKKMELKVLLVEILIMVNRIGLADSTMHLSEKNEKAIHAENIAAYIQQYFSEKLTIEKIADDLNLSKSYVSHVFKEMSGYTVMEYVMACRLQQVQYLLEAEPDKALKDIAYQTGFESISHFSRYFKSKIGVTPREYRRERLKIYQ